MGRAALFVMVALILVACGGGGGDSTGGGPGSLSISIDDPGATTLTAGSVQLFGLATCDGCPPSVTEFGFCPVVDPPQNSAIDVTWANNTTGAGGPALHAIVGHCSCLFSQCFVTYSHRWSASVPLTIGINTIELHASRAPDNPGLDSITVTRTPATVADLAATPAKGQVTLTWSPVSGAASYELYYGMSRDVTPANGTRITDVTSPYVHTGIADDATYYYTLTATAAGFPGPASPIAWATPGWRTESIAATAPTTSWRDVSITTDSAGYAHVHHSFDEGIGPAVLFHNQYLRNNGSSWLSLPVGHPSWVNAGIALDSTDTAHVAYLDFAGLAHAELTVGTWSAEVADPTAWCSAAFALDAAGKAHLAYYDQAGGPTLRYATNVSGAWVISDIGQAGSAGCSGGDVIGIALDSTGATHVIYPGDYPGDYPGYGLRYATSRGGSWSVSTLDANYIDSLALAVDINNKVHIAYTNNVSELKYATDLAGGWATEVLENAGNPTNAALAVDAAGKAHISYVDGRYGGEIHYLTDSAAGWQMLNIDTTGGIIADTAIAIDAQGKIHISYYRGGDLRYATNR